MKTIDLLDRATLKLPVGWEVLPPEAPGLFDPSWRSWHAAWDELHGDGEPFEYGPRRKGREALPYPLNVLWDLLSEEAEVAEGRWTRWLVGSAKERALAWLFVLTSPSEDVFDDIVTWSGVRISGERSARDFHGYEGDAEATGEFDLGENQLRHYRKHGLVVAAFSVEQAALAALFKGLSLKTPAPKLTSAKAAAPAEIDALVAHVPASGFPGDDPSFRPATRLLQRLAASVKRPSLAIKFQLGNGKKVRAGSIDVLEGAEGPFWMAALDYNPPGGDSLLEVTELLAGDAKGWSLVPESLEVKCRSPKVPAAAITALVAEFLAEALAGSAKPAKPRPAKKRR